VGQVADLQEIIHI